MATSDTAARITILTKRRDIEADAFSTHWSGPHADIARALPGIVRYRQHHVEGYVHGALSGVSGINGVVEMVYANSDALQAAQDTDIARRLVPEDELKFLGAWTSHEARQSFVQAGVIPPSGRSIVLLLHEVESAPLFDLGHLLQKLGGTTYQVFRAHRREAIRQHSIPVRAFAFVPDRADANGNLFQTIHSLAPVSSIFRAKVVDII